MAMYFNGYRYEEVDDKEFTERFERFGNHLTTYNGRPAVVSQDGQLLVQDKKMDRGMVDWNNLRTT